MPESFCDKIVISDTSCLIAFANIEQLEILHALCPSIITTPEVAVEYKDPLPEWIRIAQVKDTIKTNSLHTVLGLGESSAIALALETENALVILDDKKARHYAKNLGLDIIGLLGLLIRAYKQGLITDIDSVIDRLREIGFRLPTNTNDLIK
jgi:predicted nucleic acid-binding protein